MNYTPQELELCRHIAAIRARVPPPPLPPLAPLSPIQRIGYLKGEILCRESIGPFVAGGTYSARTLTVPAHSREQLLDGLGLHTQIELRSLETFVIIDGADSLVGNAARSLAPRAGKHNAGQCFSLAR